MIPKDYRDLIDDIYDRTESGSAIWNRGKYEYEVELSLGDVKIVLHHATNEKSDEPFVSFILKDFSDNYIDNWFVDTSDDNYDYMFRLFSQAKRRASGIVDLISSIREKIKNSQSIGVSNNFVPLKADSSGQVSINQHFSNEDLTRLKKYLDGYFSTNKDARKDGYQYLDNSSLKFNALYNAYLFSVYEGISFDDRFLDSARKNFAIEVKKYL